MHTLWFLHHFNNTDQDIIVNIHITQTIYYENQLYIHINVKTLDLVFSYGGMYKKSKPRVENA